MAIGVVPSEALGWDQGYRWKASVERRRGGFGAKARKRNEE